MTREILALHQAQLEHQQIWRERWPNHCQRCQGWGIVEWTENQSPLGSGHSWPETFRELCSCLDEGKCPRCAEPITITEISDDFIARCPSCEWTSENPDALPQVIELPEDRYDEEA